MSAAAGDAVGPPPRDLLADLPDRIWAELLPLVRMTLDRTDNRPRRLAPFVGWHPDKLDRPEVRRAVVDVLASDARFRADLGAVVADDHPAAVEVVDHGGADAGTIPGAVAAALIARADWEALSTLSARVAARQVERSATVAGERRSHPSPDVDSSTSSDDRDRTGPDVGALQRRIRQLEREVAARDRRADDLRAGLAQERRRREEADTALEELQEELRATRARQRDRVTRLRRRYHEARDAAVDADRRVAGLADELQRILGRLTGTAQNAPDGPRPQGDRARAPDDTAAPGEASAPYGPGSADGTATDVGPAIPRRIPPAAAGRPCALPAGVGAGTVEAARSLLRVDQLELLVDGYNVSKDLRGRPSAPLPDQRLWLLRSVAGATAGLPVRPTIVFDAAAGVAGPTPSARGARVVFTDPEELADDRIVDTVAAMGPDVPVCVVTSDRDVRRRCEALGANTLASGVFLRAIGASS